MPVEPLVDPVSLIQRIAAQNRDAFSQFYDRYSPIVYSLALRMLRAQSDAEDLLQEIFLQVWRQATVYSAERGSPEAWLINIARSRAGSSVKTKLLSLLRMERSLSMARLRAMLISQASGLPRSAR